MNRTDTVTKVRAWLDSEVDVSSWNWNFFMGEVVGNIQFRRYSRYDSFNCNICLIQMYGIRILAPLHLKPFID